MAVKIKHGRALQSISLTPLIDVVFLLLIFFLVTARFEQQDRELDVNLPAASEAKPMVASSNVLWININADGEYYIEGRKIDIDEVERILRQAAANNPVGTKVKIRADKRGEVDYLVDAINACNKAGLYDHIIVTEE